jgi:hypothetical protein
MLSQLRVVVIVAVCVSGASIGLAEEPKEDPKNRVELRWVERTFVEGLTEKQSIQASCASDDVVYPHKKPALVLARKDVAEARLNQHDLLMNGLVTHHYSVTLVLTKQAREQLAANCPDKSARVTVAVDGRYWGWAHYTTENDAKVSELCKARSFNPHIGFMSSKVEAEHIVDAFK